MCQVENAQVCELCKLPARVFCEADEANLCWQCDAQVHGANFLVARHLRTLLCHTCGNHTLWLKTGYRIDPKVPFCQHCFYETNCGVNFDEGYEESRIVSSASSAMSSFSSSTLRGDSVFGGRTNCMPDVDDEDSHTQTSNCSPGSEHVQPLLSQERKNAAAKMSCKLWMPIANSSDVGAICRKINQQSSSRGGQLQQARNQTKIRAVVRRVLDGYHTEESASSVNTSVRRGRRKRM